MTEAKSVSSLKRPRKGRGKKAALAAAGFLVLAAVAGFVYESVSVSLSRNRLPMPGTLVDAGPHSLHVRSVGHKPMTVVLEAGSGETGLSWGDIPDELSRDATVVTYDRAGYGWSENPESERSGENVVNELHLALQNANLPGPYVLVGHSLGGMYTRLFAMTYPDEVAGLVLVDARPEDFERLSAPVYEAENYQSSTPSAAVLSVLKQSGILRLFQNALLDGMIEPEDRDIFLNVIARPAFFHTIEEEGKLSQSLEDVLRGREMGGLPVRIIARAVAPDYAAAGISAEAAEKVEQLWRRGQEEMLNLSGNSQLIIAEESGHNVMNDQPELVEEVVRGLLKDIEQMQKF